MSPLLCIFWNINTFTEIAIIYNYAVLSSIWAQTFHLIWVVYSQPLAVCTDIRLRRCTRIYCRCIIQSSSRVQCYTRTVLVIYLSHMHLPVFFSHFLSYHTSCCLSSFLSLSPSISIEINIFYSTFLRIHPHINPFPCHPSICGIFCNSLKHLWFFFCCVLVSFSTPFLSVLSFFASSLFLFQERDAYLPLAESASKMYFVITDLSKINNMYRFSLASFLRLFQRALQAKKVTGWHTTLIVLPFSSNTAVC